MKKKIVILLEFCAILVAMMYYTVKVVVPEYREKIGSSDHFIQNSLVSNIVEIRIDNNTDFAVLFDKEGRLYHLFFFDKYSVSLYNNNIESQTMENGLEIMMPILIENNLLHNGSQIEMIRSNDNYYKEFQKVWNASITKYSISVNIQGKKQDISQKAQELGINTDSYSSMLLELDFYSKEIIKNYADQHERLDEKKSIKYANTIYKKIESLNQDNQISEEISITMIPADKNHEYYPTSRSWYKIKEGKVYAFIELEDNNISYSYCYMGSIDERVKGECQNE